jgi:hypothetical protein
MKRTDINTNNKKPIMKESKWKTQVNYLEFCNRLGYECPKCKEWLRLDADPLTAATARGSDMLMDQCSICGTLIIIDNSSSLPLTIFEGYDNQIDFMERITEIKSLTNTPISKQISSQQTAKKWWNFWK